MPSKRPSPPKHSSSQSTSREYGSPPPTKRFRHDAQPLSHIKIYVVQAKLDDDEIYELFGLVENNAQKLCIDVREADVVITNVHMRKRLERHIDWALARTKAVVTPDWLRDSVKNNTVVDCGQYAALACLHDETEANCPECSHPSANSPDSPCADEGCRCRGKQAGTPPPSPSKTEKPLQGQTILPSPPPNPPASQTRSHDCMTTPSRSVVRSHPTPSAPSIPANLLPPSPPYVTPLASLLHNARYACQRASPLVCPNQSLVNALNVVRKSRDLEGDERSALSYARAIGVLKAYPNHVTSKSQVAKLPYLGSKLLGMIDEYVKTGQIAETESTLASPRFQTLTLFASVYGIGPTTARSLYARGLRTLEHLERFYGADEPPDTPVEPMVVEDDISGSGGAALVRTALGYRADLAIPIPWDEVEEIGRLVAHALEAVAPGCVSTIVGGYRRGKLESNDVDIVFTNPDRSLFRDHAAPKRKHDGGTEGEGLCKRVVRRLAERGMVTHVIHHATESFRDRGALKSVHWDTLEKALTVFVLPADSPIARRQMEAYGHPLRRRVDLICARAEAYWTAVVGWSGSTMFQRDLRLWAKVEKGLKFDSGGITRRRDSKPMYAKTEKEVFDLLGLEWIDPMWRNADA